MEGWFFGMSTGIARACTTGYNWSRMTPLSRRAQACAPSPTLAITAKANQMKADGINVVAFGAGEPDFDTPDHIKAAAIDALAKGFTKYTPSAGIPALKNAIINKLQRDNGLTFTAAEVIVSCGGNIACTTFFRSSSMMAMKSSFRRLTGFRTRSKSSLPVECPLSFRHRMTTTSYRRLRPSKLQSPIEPK
ncbi:MAG: hypothetical protein RL169_1424 [Armatimonadota bacterium]